MNRLDKNIIGLILEYLDFEDTSRCCLISRRLRQVAINQLGGENPFNVRKEYHLKSQELMELENQIYKIEEKFQNLQFVMETEKFGKWIWTKLVNAFNAKIRNGDYDSPVKFSQKIKDYRQYLVEDRKDHVDRSCWELIDLEWPDESDEVQRPPEIDLDAALVGVSKLKFNFLYRRRGFNLNINFQVRYPDNPDAEPGRGSTYIMGYHVDLNKGKQFWNGWDGLCPWDFVVRDNSESEWRYFQYAPVSNSIQHILELALHECFMDTLVPMLHNIGHKLPDFDEYDKKYQTYLKEKHQNTDEDSSSSEDGYRHYGSMFIGMWQ